MRQKDTQCSKCGLWTHINTSNGDGMVFCDDKCRFNYEAQRGKISKTQPYCVRGKGWFNWSKQ